jgi:hypothetical protein
MEGPTHATPVKGHCVRIASIHTPQALPATVNFEPENLIQAALIPIMVHKLTVTKVLYSLASDNMSDKWHTNVTQQAYARMHH